MANIIIIVILVIIIGTAAGYIIRAKKRGVKCIGCPNGGCKGCTRCSADGCDKSN